MKFTGLYVFNGLSDLVLCSFQSLSSYKTTLLAIQCKSHPPLLIGGDSLLA